jgi:sugar lactone lactonase YvrE
VKPTAAASTLALLLALGCGRKETPAPQTAAAAPVRVTTITGFSTPESVLWSAKEDVWFVSNINGSPVAKDGNGFISRVSRDGVIDSLHFILGGRDSVTLNGPKGMSLVGDTLWVADIDAVRAFDAHTGKRIASIELGKQATFLNDVAVGPDGVVYITDSGLGFDDKGNPTHPGPDRIFGLTGRTAKVLAEGDWLGRPNGITWDGVNNRFVVVSFGAPTLLGWKPGVAKVDTIGSGPGAQDGVEIVGGDLLVTSWADSTVFSVTSAGNKKIVTGVASPADLGVDQLRGLIAVPLFTQNTVEVWRVK